MAMVVDIDDVNDKRLRGVLTTVTRRPQQELARIFKFIALLEPSVPRY
jgi:hypothetical protein